MKKLLSLMSVLLAFLMLLSACGAPTVGDVLSLIHI